MHANIVIFSHQRKNIVVFSLILYALI